MALHTELDLSTKVEILEWAEGQPEVNMRVHVNSTENINYEHVPSVEAKSLL